MTLFSMSSRSSVDSAPARCSGGHGVYSCWRLRVFLCLTLVSCWSISPVTFYYWAFKFAIFIRLLKALFFRKSRILAPFVFKIRMWQVLRTSCWVLLCVSLRNNFNIYFFNWDFVMPSWWAPVYFTSSSSLFFFVRTAFSCTLRDN